MDVILLLFVGVKQHTYVIAFIFIYVIALARAYARSAMCLIVTFFDTEDEAIFAAVEELMKQLKERKMIQE